ncbi:hypothetical protein OGAPHI_005756 [Ogataea philodendri]|uniref:Autophagy-related protein 11 n=2 Tax=Ogataea TaxID=461281 RepID=A0A9P8P0M5_9ASCO|nr:uncharacterized protein OGAPHI_005756 [Ogataea philodendri]KAH3662504.1 hypothetical protein OGAPHI_005756 [Ogataea philodendri]
MMSSIYRQNPSRDTHLPSALSIYNSLTGDKSVASAYQFSNLEALKQFISSSFNIAVENLFLLTPFGIKLKFSMVVHEEIAEIYVFDRRYFNVNNIESSDNLSGLKDLVQELNQTNLINMIKPLSSPILSDELAIFVEKLSLVLENTRNIKAVDINLNNLRLLLNSLKRNSGWASALLSDFKKTVAFDESTPEDDDLEVILTSLNVLIQYVGLVFKSLEKKFNDSIDTLLLLQTNTLVDQWEDQYRNLQKISFGFKTTSNTREKLTLSQLVNESHLKTSASESRKLNKAINERLILLRGKIESEIIVPRQDLSKEYDEYVAQYMRPETDTTSKSKKIEDCKRILAELETYVSRLINASSSLPSFEELITTSSQTSANLSTASVTNIKKLIELYRFHQTDLVPQISNLADRLYQIQVNKLNSRKELQTKLISSTLITVTKIQLNIMKLTSVLNTDISKTIGSIKDHELQLSVVTDLPLIFGIYAIANLNNLKYGISLKTLVKRANEIFEMLRFMESKNRARWLREFLASSGGEKLEFLSMDEEEKKRFIYDNLFAYKLEPVETAPRRETSPPANQQQPLSPVSPHENNYLTSINKLLHNINGFPITSKPIATDLPKQRETNIFINLSKYVTVNDIIDYISSLKSAGIDPNIINKLEECLRDFGLTYNESGKKTISTEDGEEVVVKGGNMGDLGTFDASDVSFMRLFKKFIKNFESEGIEISIGSRKEDSSANEELIKGYERRIKKLENLLHARNFQQFNDQWSHRNRPVHTLPNPVSRRQSDSSPDPVGQDNTILFDDNVRLGRKMIEIPPSHYGERIEKLEKERDELKKELEAYKSGSEASEVEKLKKELDELKQASAKKDAKIESLEKENTEFKESNEKLTKSNKKLETLCSELKNMKSDLLENMSQKETEFTKESRVNQEELNELRLKVEELEEDESNLVNVNKSLNERLISKDQLLCGLYELIQASYNKLNQLSGEIFGNLTRVCLLLESIGLLLVRETTSVEDQPGLLTIKRVKGLRSRKRQIKQSNDSTNNNLSLINDTLEDTDQIDNALMEVVSSEVVPEAEQYLHWVDMNVLNYTISSDLGIDEEIVSTKKEDGSVIDMSLCEESSIEKKVKKLISNYESLNIEKGFQNFLRFNHIDSELVVERVYRRFNDVETLARKLQKDKNQQKQELKALTTELDGKIAFRNFKVGDLVLFLKTLTPASEETNGDEEQPWAAFNFGSPNYYLKNSKDGDGYIDLSDRDWLVGRISRIESKVVNDQNFGDKSSNPFKLARSTAWYYVEAREVKE